MKYFLLAKEGYFAGNPMMAMRLFVNTNKQALAAFVRASIEGWKSFYNDPTPALSKVKKLRSDATDEWLNYAVATMKELKLLNGGDAEKGGIGVMIWPTAWFRPICSSRQQTENRLTRPSL